MTPSDEKDLLKLFSKFSGKEVCKNYYSRTSDVDPVLAAMTKLAWDNGVTLRTWFPGVTRTESANPGHINAYIEKGADGKHRIGKKFNFD